MYDPDREIIQESGSGNAERAWGETPPDCLDGPPGEGRQADTWEGFFESSSGKRFRKGSRRTRQLLEEAEKRSEQLRNSQPDYSEGLLNQRFDEGKRLAELVSRKLDFPKIFPTRRIFFNLTELEKELVRMVFSKARKMRAVPHTRWKEETLMIIINEFLEKLEDEENDFA